MAAKYTDEHPASATYHDNIPRGSIYTTIRESGPKIPYHTIEGIMGPNSLMVVYVDPLGYIYIYIYIYFVFPLRVSDSGYLNPKSG